MAQVDACMATNENSRRTWWSVRARRLRYVVDCAWVFNIGLLFVAFGWVYLFGASREMIQLTKYLFLQRLFGMGAAELSTGLIVRDPLRIVVGVSIAFNAFAFAACGLVLMLGSLFVGGARYRTTRMWLVFTAVACGWLGLVVEWQSVYWIGQQHRMKAELPAAVAMVAALKAEWPTVDSELPDSGPFLAYPMNQPTALMSLSDAKFPNTGLRFSAVERTGDDVMRFELAGAEQGAWLEWRGDGSEPRSFVGGLDSEYVVVRAARLSTEWFLVRYRAAGLVERGVRLSPQTR
jgi:hypothetical protein